MTIANLEQPAETQAAVALGLDIIFKPQSAFITAKFKDLFYDGIDVNCDQKHAAAQAICQQFQAGAVPGALPVNATHYKFSLMGAASQLDMPSVSFNNLLHFFMFSGQSHKCRSL